MAVQKFFCTGCGNELKDWAKWNQANGQVKQSHIASIPEADKLTVFNQINGDDFCTNCLVKAPTYWESKSRAIAESHEVLTNRLGKLLHNTFRQPLQAVGGKKV